MARHRGRTGADGTGRPGGNVHRVGADRPSSHDPVAPRGRRGRGRGGDQAPACRGAAACGTTSLASPPRTMRPRYINPTRSDIWRTTLRSWLMKSAANPVRSRRVAHQVEAPAPGSDTVQRRDRSSQDPAVSESSASAGGDHHARGAGRPTARAVRWPPGPGRRPTEAISASARSRRSARGMAGKWISKGSAIWVTNGQAAGPAAPSGPGRSSCIRRDPPPVRPRRSTGTRRAVEEHLARGRRQGGPEKKNQGGLWGRGGGGLAAARLAHQAQHLAAGQVESTPSTGLERGGAAENSPPGRRPGKCRAAPGRWSSGAGHASVLSRWGAGAAPEAATSAPAVRRRQRRRGAPGNSRRRGGASSQTP